MLGTPLNPSTQGPCDFTPLCSDGDAEDGEQGPIWTFPPTIRPSPHSKLHKGTALHGPQKVWPTRPGPSHMLGGWGLSVDPGGGCGVAPLLGLVLPQVAPSKEARNGVGAGHTCPDHSSTAAAHPLWSCSCSLQSLSRGSRGPSACPRWSGLSSER